MDKNVLLDLKILVIGNSGVGKTSYVKRWTKDYFSEESKATILPEFHFKVFYYKDKPYRINLWDIGGQDTSPIMLNMYSRDSHGCLVMCDVTKSNNLEDSLKWKEAVNIESQFLPEEGFPFLLLQNKTDLIIDEYELKDIEEKTRIFCEENKFIGYYLISVKNNKGVEESLKYLIESVVDRIEKYKEKGNKVFNRVEEKSIKLRNYGSFVQPEKGSKCC